MFSTSSVTAVAILMSSFLFNLILKPPSANGVAAAAAAGQPLIPYNIDWIFPQLRRPSRLWHLGSTAVIGFVGFVSKIVIGKCGQGQSGPCLSVTYISDSKLTPYLYYNFMQSSIARVRNGTLHSSSKPVSRNLADRVCLTFRSITANRVSGNVKQWSRKLTVCSFAALSSDEFYRWAISAKKLHNPCGLVWRSNLICFIDALCRFVHWWWCPQSLCSVVNIRQRTTLTSLLISFFACLAAVAMVDLCSTTMMTVVCAVRQTKHCPKRSNS